MSPKSYKFILIFAGLLVVASLVIRSDEKAYHLYYGGDYQAAQPHLADRAAGGDGFAAYLMGESELHLLLEKQDLTASIKHFKRAAELGSIGGAIKEYLVRSLAADRSTESCRQLKLVLDWGTRARNPKAAVMAGDVYKETYCGRPDPVLAARYYGQAFRLEARLGTRLDSLFPTLSAETAALAKAAITQEFPVLDQKTFFANYRTLESGGR